MNIKTKCKFYLRNCYVGTALNNAQHKKGILGTVLAFMIAREEKGRYILHSHWQLFLKELSMELGNVLFSSDVEGKRESKKRILGAC